MFPIWKPKAKQSATVSAVSAVAVVDPPVSQFMPKALMPESEYGEYLERAKAVGLETAPALLTEKLRQFLADENMHAFNDKQVHDFLDHKFGKGKWVWSPLRESDIEHRAGWHDGEGVEFGRRQYREPLPLPVLITVQKIAEAMPEAHFYVSSPETVGDPFLYVTAGVRGYIVERWDEPNFRER